MMFSRRLVHLLVFLSLVLPLWASQLKKFDEDYLRLQTECAELLTASVVRKEQKQELETTLQNLIDSIEASKELPVNDSSRLLGDCYAILYQLEEIHPSQEVLEYPLELNDVEASGSVLDQLEEMMANYAASILTEMEQIVEESTEEFDEYAVNNMLKRLNQKLQHAIDNSIYSQAISSTLTNNEPLEDFGATYDVYDESLESLESSCGTIFVAGGDDDVASTTGIVSGKRADSELLPRVNKGMGRKEEAQMLQPKSDSPNSISQGDDSEPSTPVFHTPASSPTDHKLVSTAEEEDIDQITNLPTPPFMPLEFDDDPINQSPLSSQNSVDDSHVPPNTNTAETGSSSDTEEEHDIYLPGATSELCELGFDATEWHLVDEEDEDEDEEDSWQIVDDDNDDPTPKPSSPPDTSISRTTLPSSNVERVLEEMCNPFEKIKEMIEKLLRQSGQAHRDSILDQINVIIQSMIQSYKESLPAEFVNEPHHKETLHHLLDLFGRRLKDRLLEERPVRSKVKFTF